jgi:hypothetical protein
MGDITVSHSEIKKILFGFKNVSAPGPSGQTKQLYTLLYKLMPDIFLHTFETLLSLPSLFDTPFEWIVNRSIIFIPKNDEKIPSPSDLRPISLLEISYKIMSKILLRFLDPYLPSSLKQPIWFYQ